MHGTRILEEADRLMTVCNSCRYCEGLCAVFPAMEMRRSFSDGDLNYLANLCHACGACYTDCQFSPPHEFNVNVPQTLAIARADSWAAYAWPRAFSGVFARNGLAISVIAALSVAAFIFGFAAFNDRQVLYAIHTGPGAFYRLMPHNAMAGLFGAALLYAIIALAMGVRAFWRDIGEPIGMRADPGSIWQAMKDAGAISTAAASAASTRTSGRATAARSITISPSTVLCSASPQPASRRCITISLRAKRRMHGGICRWCWARWAVSGF
jgi:citrate/tricarballylate utilization protein